MCKFAVTLRVPNNTVQHHASLISVPNSSDLTAQFCTYWHILRDYSKPCPLDYRDVNFVESICLLKSADHS